MSKRAFDKIKAGLDDALAYAEADTMTPSEALEGPCIWCGGTGIQQVARDMLARTPPDEMEYRRQLAEHQMWNEFRGERCRQCDGTGRSLREPHHG